MEKQFIGPGQEAIRKFEQTAKTAMENRVGVFKKRIQKALDEIRALTDEKYEVERSPITKAELLELAKAELENKKKQFIPDLLRKHLEACQLGKDVIFSEAAVNAKLFPRDDYWMLFYYLVNTRALKAAVASLPEKALFTKAEREKKIREINKKIEALKSLVDSELEAAATLPSTV